MVRKEYAQSVRTALAALLFGLLAVTSGCFSGDVNLVVNDDGSADLKTTLVSVPMLAEIVEQSKAAAVEKNPDAQVTPVTKDNNMSGYEISEHYATLDKLSDVDFSPHTRAKTRGLRRQSRSSTTTGILISSSAGRRGAAARARSRATSRSPMR